MTPTSASEHWDRAIAAADARRREEALESFRRAIEIDPHYYISVIEPRSGRARDCWIEAVERYKRDADVRARASGAAPNRCAQCEKDLGLGWHYQFESISLATTVGAQCPQCDRCVCADDLKFGADGNYEPCADCGIALAVLSEGPAYSSMVDAARRQRRYRGAIKEPSVLGRPVERG